MPHVDHSFRASSAARGVARSTFGDPALWAWVVVALMALMPLRAALVGA